MNTGPDWDAAFRALVRDDDGKPLASLLRGLPSIDGELPPPSTPAPPPPNPPDAAKSPKDVMLEVPRTIVNELAELLDPKSPWNCFARPPSCTQIEVINGLPRVKGATELLRADEADLAARARLKKSRKTLDTASLDFEKIARDEGDNEALRAFANLRKAHAKFRAAQESTYSAVELSVKPLSKVRLRRLARDASIWGSMLVALQNGETVSDAAQRLGEKFKMSDRHITGIWAKARKDYPALLAKIFRHSQQKKRQNHKRRRRTY